MKSMIRTAAQPSIYKSQDTLQSSEPQIKLTVRGHSLSEGSYLVRADDELRMKLLVEDKLTDPQRVTIRLQHEDEKLQLCRPLAARTAMLSGVRSILFTIELPKANPVDLSQQLLDEINEATERGLLTSEDADELRSNRYTLAADLAGAFKTAIPGHYKVQALYDTQPEPLQSDVVKLNVMPLEYAGITDSVHRDREHLNFLNDLIRRLLTR